jgi:hypothetical protein
MVLYFTDFVAEIDHDVGLPRSVGSAYNASVNEGENDHWKSGGPEPGAADVPSAPLVRVPRNNRRYEVRNHRDDNYDVAVIGGGPAWATTAYFLAQSGRRVVLIDKAQHPRFHIGESLLPHNLPTLDSLGLAQGVAKIGVHKPGDEFISPEHDHRQTFLF